MDKYYRNGKEFDSDTLPLSSSKPTTKPEEQPKDSSHTDSSDGSIPDVGSQMESAAAGARGLPPPTTGRLPMSAPEAKNAELKGKMLNDLNNRWQRGQLTDADTYYAAKRQIESTNRLQYVTTNSGKGELLATAFDLPSDNARVREGREVGIYRVADMFDPTKSEKDFLAQKAGRAKAVIDENTIGIQDQNKTLNDLRIEEEQAKKADRLAGAETNKKKQEIEALQTDASLEQLRISHDLAIENVKNGKFEEGERALYQLKDLDLKKRLDAAKTDAERAPLLKEKEQLELEHELDMARLQKDSDAQTKAWTKAKINLQSDPSEVNYKNFVELTRKMNLPGQLQQALADQADPAKSRQVMLDIQSVMRNTAELTARAASAGEKAAKDVADNGGDERAQQEARLRAEAPYQGAIKESANFSSQMMNDLRRLKADKNASIDQIWKVSKLTDEPGTGANKDINPDIGFLEREAKNVFSKPFAGIGSADPLNVTGNAAIAELISLGTDPEALPAAYENYLRQLISYQEDRVVQFGEDGKKGLRDRGNEERLKNFNEGKQVADAARKLLLDEKKDEKIKAMFVGQPLNDVKTDASRSLDAYGEEVVKKDNEPVYPAGKNRKHDVSVSDVDLVKNDISATIDSAARASKEEIGPFGSRSKAVDFTSELKKQLAESSGVFSTSSKTLRDEIFNIAIRQMNIDAKKERDSQIEKKKSIESRGKVMSEQDMVLYNAAIDRYYQLMSIKTKEE